MNKKIQKEIISQLRKLVDLCPEQRFGQILYNYYLQYCNNKDPFYIRDVKTLEFLQKSIDNLSK